MYPRRLDSDTSLSIKSAFAMKPLAIRVFVDRRAGAIRYPRARGRSTARGAGETNARPTLKLACGAVLSALRRTSSGRFSLDDATPLDALTPEHARDLDFLLGHLDVVRIAADETARFRNGQPISRPGESKIEDLRLARVNDYQGTFLGVGEVLNGKLYPRKVRAST